tara:strand:- start:675 stop:971 length:297 start_codon:yes stop_codon:yes gene_type:complete
MYEFLIGLILGILIGIEDVGEPVPYQTITYTDSGRVVKVYNTSAFKYRYMANAYAVGWNTNNYQYWETKDFIRPVYTKSIVINKKPKPKPKPRTEDDN